MLSPSRIAKFDGLEPRHCRGKRYKGELWLQGLLRNRPHDRCLVVWCPNHSATLPPNGGVVFVMSCWEPKVYFYYQNIQHKSLPLRVKYSMGMHRVISSRHVFKPHINGISYFSSNYGSQNSKVLVVICSSSLLGRVSSVSILTKHSFLVPMTDAVCSVFCVYSGIPLFLQATIKV